MRDIKREDAVFEKTLKEIIGKYKSCRKEKGMTQNNIYELTDIGQPNLTRFENCKYNPTVRMLTRIADAMDMRVKVSLVPKDGD